MSEAAVDVIPDHVLGDPRAPVVVVEYGDFECPYCAALAPIVHDLVEESEGRVALVFRNYPLADVHPHALTAALAAEATAPFGVFWQMHDLLFRQQARLSDPDLSSYAESLGVDGSVVVGQAAQPFADKVERDFLAGVELGVPGTPTLFINGVRYEGRLDLTSLRRATAGLTRTAVAQRRRWWQPR